MRVQREVRALKVHLVLITDVSGMFMRSGLHYFKLYVK